MTEADLRRLLAEKKLRRVPRDPETARIELRLEAEAAAADPEDLAEARRVRAEMDAIAPALNDVE